VSRDWGDVVDMVAGAGRVVCPLSLFTIYDGEGASVFPAKDNLLSLCISRLCALRPRDVAK
jgi:hypothetical protein